MNSYDETGWNPNPILDLGVEPTTWWSRNDVEILAEDRLQLARFRGEWLDYED